MKKNHSFLLFSTALCMFAACSNEQEAPLADKRVPVTVTAGIKAEGGQTSRATDTNWGREDAIGIYMVNASQPLAAPHISEGADNIKYVTSLGDGNFISAAATVYYPIQGDVDFYAYSPYATVTGYKYMINVSDQSNQEGLDFMYATPVKGKNKIAPAVTFNFSHQLCKLVFTVQPKQGGGLTQADLAGLTVRIKSQYTQAGFDLASGTLVTPSEFQDITLKKTSENTFEAILLPDLANSRTLEFDLDNGHDKPFIWTMPVTLTAGSKYIYTVNLTRTAAEVSGSINPWIENNGGSVDAK